MKPTSQKKSKATKTKLQTVLTLDDFDFIIAVVSDASQDLLQNTEAKQEPCTIELRQNSEGYSRPFTPAAQCPLRPRHQKNQSWEMSLPNSAE
jgi:hypothetical protein